MTKEYINKAIRPLIDLICFAGIWGVLFFKGRYLLFIQEQTQLFQNDWHYLADNIVAAGGFSRMATEAVVQFCHVPWIGVTIISLIAFSGLVLLRHCLNHAIDNRTVSLLLSVASFIPLIYNVIVCEDTFALVSFVLSLSCCAGALKLQGKYSWVIVSLMVPLLYVLCGSASVILPLMMVIAALADRMDPAALVKSSVPVGVYLISGFVMARAGYIGSVSDLFVQAYPLYDDPEQEYNIYPMFSWLFSMGGALIVICVKSFKRNTTAKVHVISASFVLLCSGVTMWLMPEKNYAQNVDYKVYNDWARLHYLYSEERYEDLLEIFEEKMPVNSVESNYINLSLYKTGRLATDFFNYKPSWLHFSLRSSWLDMPFPFPFIWVETCDQMGALGRAQQSAFEGNILAGPRGSAPMVKYLAESEIVRGNYIAADKYLRCLENTIYYRGWAKSQRAFLNDKAVESDAHYSTKRACYYEDTRTLFDTNDLWLMMDVMKNSPAHYSTFEYTGVMTLAAGELKTFVNFIFKMMEAGTIRFPLAPIFQDALVMALPNSKEIHQLYGIEPQRVKDYAEYKAAISGKSTLHTNSVISKNSKRYWHYIYTMSKNAPKAKNPRK